MKSIFNPIRGITTFLFIVCNVILHAVILTPFALIKCLLPRNQFIIDIIDLIAESWITTNNIFYKLTRNLDIRTTGLEGLSKKEWYVCIANHQSWVDILVIQIALNRKIPLLKFFLKKELIYIPIIGLAWWVLDFPFMSRYSKKIIEKKPKLEGKDIKTTKKLCERFRKKPIAILNFVEGTRYTEAKYLKQKSPFRNLLKPKSAGLAFALKALDGKIQKILNLTIKYEEATSFWNFLCGDIKKVIIDIETIPVTEKLIGNYGQDLDFKNQFREEISKLWQSKDDKLDSIKI